ncbi:BglG family transcription antiterminator [Cohnella thermotolerans]|uniref:BglG family transcription antiterminator n=1 Tax=Cohnella thermotolerans TaxID=329858 RepID=UPI0012EC9F31|nr:BglG family transcription antiterminator [Cohnella thermotolerans]
MNSRQQQILLFLLQSPSFITLKAISDALQISIRTIQRELDGLDDVLNRYGLVSVKKTGVGLSIEGNEEAKANFVRFLTVGKSHKIFTPEERQSILMQLLLTMKEPTKLYYFSNKFQVTEATISNDLLKIEPWFEKHQIQLVRKPGLGVYLEGKEQNIRKAIIDLFYQHFSQDQLMDMLSSYTYSFTNRMKLEISIRNRLLHFIDPDSISKIEQVVQSVAHRGYEWTDSAYVGLIVHIALAVQRLKHGEHITIDFDTVQKLKDTPEYHWAHRMVQELSSLLEMTIPESEVGYITLHLLGVKARKIRSNSTLPHDIDDYVHQMVRIVGDELKLSLENDLALIQHLGTHLESAIQRIKLHMDIRNPLLEHIKGKYPDIFAAARKAAIYLEGQTQCSIPEEEVGYIAMHFGAAVVRRQEFDQYRHRVLLVCTSGIGTSRLLATQIEKELPHVHVVDIVSLLHIEEWMKKGVSVDLIISTVPFQYLHYPVIVVNPFLLPQDLELMKSQLKNLKRAERKKAVVEDNTEIEDTISKMNRYGEAMTHILENIFLVQDVQALTKELLIQEAATFVQTKFSGVQGELLQKELKKREELGGWVLRKEQFAIFHCRSHAVESMCIAVFRLRNDVNWGNDDQPIPVRTVLLLLASRQAPKEHLELMGEVSSVLIEEEFVSTLKYGDFEEVKRGIKAVLGKGYLEKTNALLRGSR